MLHDLLEVLAPPDMIAAEGFEMTRRHTRLRRFGLGLFLALLPLLASCGEKGAASPKTETTKTADTTKTTDKERVPVEVATLARGPIEAVLRFSTNLEAESEVQVFSQAARLVEELLVEEGKLVRKDQVLLRLQDDEQRSQLQKVESQLRKAEREYERQKSLFEKALISEQAYNDATYELDQLRLALDDARRELSYTEVRAPIAGTVTRRMVNLGDHVTLNQHLFDLVDFNTLVARIYVPEKELPKLRIGQPARLLSTSLSEGPRPGEVLRIAPIVDSQSGTVKVTVGIPSHQGLLPGMYVEVELVTAVHADALLVPKRAIVYDDDQAFLFRLVEGSRVERVSVVPLLESRDVIEPAEGSGLAAGDQVVVAGQAALKNGAEVRLLGEDAAGASP